MEEQGYISQISETGLAINQKEFKSKRLTSKSSPSVIDFVRNYIGDREFVFANPSDSSCNMIIPGTGDCIKLAGSCLRRIYLNRMNVPATEIDDMPYLRRMMIGNKIEEAERENISKAGYCHAHNKKFIYIPKQDSNIAISGEVDMIIKKASDVMKTASTTLSRLFETNVVANNIKQHDSILEVKSFYGYDARREIFGNTKVIGRPKPEHVLQTAQYLLAAKAMKGKAPGHAMFLKVVNNQLVEDKEPITADAAVIYYIERGACDTKEYLLELDDNANIFVNGEEIGQFNLSIDRVLENYEALYHHLNTETVPLRTPRYMYEDEQVQKMARMGLVSKTRMLKYNAKQLCVGDWQCKYCSHSKFCIGDTPWKANTVPEDSYIQDQIQIVTKMIREQKEHWRPTLIPTLLASEE